MRVLGKRVLVEQTMTKKESKIILMDKGKDDDTFTTTFKVLQVGSECPAGEVTVGDVPIFSKHVDFHGAKVVEEIKDKKVVLHTIVYFDDIIGVE